MQSLEVKKITYKKLEETKQNYINKLHEHRLKILEIQKQLILIESQIKN